MEERLQHTRPHTSLNGSPQQALQLAPARANGEQALLKNEGALGAGSLSTFTSSPARAVAPAGRARRPRQTPGKLALGAIESASRVWASITARIRIGRPRTVHPRRSPCSRPRSVRPPSAAHTGSARPACAAAPCCGSSALPQHRGGRRVSRSRPTLSPEQNMQPPVAIPDTARGQITQPHRSSTCGSRRGRYRCDDRRKPVAEHARRSPTPYDLTP